MRLIINSYTYQKINGDEANLFLALLGHYTQFLSSIYCQWMILLTILATLLSLLSSLITQSL